MNDQGSKLGRGISYANQLGLSRLDLRFLWFVVDEDLIVEQCICYCLFGLLTGQCMAYIACGDSQKLGAVSVDCLRIFITDSEIVG